MKHYRWLSTCVLALLCFQVYKKRKSLTCILLFLNHINAKSLTPYLNLTLYKSLAFTTVLRIISQNIRKNISDKRQEMKTMYIFPSPQR